LYSGKIPYPLWEKTLLAISNVTFSVLCGYKQGCYLYISFDTTRQPMEDKFQRHVAVYNMVCGTMFHTTYSI
jgi:hypothetical protein